jgi:phospholipase/carboxylesterase
MLKTQFIPAMDGKSRWCMFVLHGLGDSIAGYQWMPEALQLPWLNYILVNAPDSYYGGYSWYDFMGESTEGINRSHQLLCDLLARHETNGYSLNQTFLFGFSQGCLMTLETGLRHDKLFAGLIGISGYVHDVKTLMRNLPEIAFSQHLLVTHGTLDALLPINPVRQQIQELKDAGIDIDWREFAKDHTIAGEEELQVISDFLCKRRDAVQTVG